MDTACSVAGVSNVRTVWAGARTLVTDKKLRRSLTSSRRAVRWDSVARKFCMPPFAVGGGESMPKGVT
jgi:hypothetical protein